jgi:hypothetical protein
MSDQLGSCSQYQIAPVQLLSTFLSLSRSVIAEQLPADVDDVRQTVAWLLRHAGLLKQAGAEVERTLAHILFGLGIGMLMALYDVSRMHDAFGPLAREGQISIPLCKSRLRVDTTSPYRIRSAPKTGVWNESAS